MSKGKRKPRPAMPYWIYLDRDGCWFCKNRRNCNQCKSNRDEGKTRVPKKRDLINKSKRYDE